MFVHPRHYNKRVFPHLSRARSHENDGNTFLLHPAQFYGCVYKDKQAVRSCNNGVPQNGCAQSVHHQRASSREWKGGPQYPTPPRDAIAGMCSHSLHLPEGGSLSSLWSVGWCRLHHERLTSCFYQPIHVSLIAAPGQTHILVFLVGGGVTPHQF